MTKEEAILTALALSEGQHQQSKELPPCELTDYILDEAGRSRQHKQAYIVVAEPGLGIAEHHHDEDVVLFYARVTETPVIVADVPYLPELGEVLTVPALVKHEVPPNVTGEVRVSVAIKIAV